MIPHIIETKAPTKNAIAVQIPCSVKKVMTANIIPTKIKQIKYSAFKNYLAPYVKSKLPQISFSQAQVKGLPDS